MHTAAHSFFPIAWQNLLQAEDAAINTLVLTTSAQLN